MKVHIVQKGDTLWKIAKQHQIPFDEIKRLNAHLANPDYIVPGMEIFLPDQSTMPKEMKERPREPQLMPTTPAPKKETPKKEMPVKEVPVKEMPKKETPMPPTPVAPPVAQPSQPNWIPYPQPVPMPMPQPQVQPIIMPQQPSAPHTINIEQPTMPMPIPMPQQPVQPMQCPSCKMTVMIAMPQMERPKEEKEVKVEQKPKEKKEIQPTPCNPTPCNQTHMPMMLPMEQAPLMQPNMVAPFGGGHCTSCQQLMHQQPMHHHPMFHQPMHHHPMFHQPIWHEPVQQPNFWPQQAPMPMKESTSMMPPQVAGTQQWPPHHDLKCEMQQHIVNEYYDEIREIEQSNRPCHPQQGPQMHMPHFHQ